MANNKIQLANGLVLLDLTADTVDAEHLAQGYTAHDRSGAIITGTMSGGSNWTLLASQEFTVSTSSTSSESVGNIQLTLSDYNDPNTVLWVHIRDTAGMRSGYFYGSDAIFLHYQLASGNTSAVTTRPAILFRASSDTAYAAAATSYGVYAYRLYYTSSAHYVQIYSRYYSTSTGTINGTYKCDVYKLTMADGMKLFD